jgi:hypothetical protein
MLLFKLLWILLFRAQHLTACTKRLSQKLWPLLNWMIWNWAIQRVWTLHHPNAPWAFACCLEWCCDWAEASWVCRFESMYRCIVERWVCCLVCGGQWSGGRCHYWCYIASQMLLYRICRWIFWFFINNYAAVAASGHGIILEFYSAALLPAATCLRVQANDTSVECWLLYCYFIKCN